MFRQAISCDVCGVEKKQTNHWFTAYQENGELRISWLSADSRQSQDSMHLCGQTCLHKLVDEFMVKTIAARQQTATEAQAEAEAELPRAGEVGAASGEMNLELESSARLLPSPPAAILPRTVLRCQPEMMTMLPQPLPVELTAACSEPPRQASRSWHAQAWEREREREQRAAESRSERRRSSA